MVKAKRGLLALVVVALAAYGCSSSSSPKASPSPSTTTPTASTGSPKASKPPAALPAYYRQHLAWHGCGSGFQCATLRVPLDYAHAGRLISVAVIRLPASSSSHRIGSLLINPGGPGGSGIDYARAARRILPSEIRRVFDIVGFDPRGVGQSTPIRCLSYSQLDTFVASDPTPDNAAEHQQIINLSKQIANGCEQRSGYLLPHVATIDVARDMDVLRYVLGDKKLTYMGKSYGTLLGAVYAGLFPHNIRAMVLDGAIDPSTDGEAQNKVQAIGFERALSDYFNYCLRQGGCPLGSSRSQVEQSYQALVARDDRSPFPAPGAPGHRTLQPGNMFLGVAAGLYSPSSGWPALTEGFSQAERGDGSVFLQLSDLYSGRNSDGTYDNEIESNTAINCVDRPESHDVASYDRDAANFAKVAPHFGVAIAYGSMPCAFWPVPPEDHPRRITAAGSPPILVIGTTRDPATPYEWAQGLASQLSRGVLLTYNGDGHTVYGDGESSCVDHLTDAYLLRLTPPAAGTRCS